MAKNYYLINGSYGKGNAVNVLNNGKLQSEFKDISMLDLSTIDIDYNNASEILGEYNKNQDGFYYDFSFTNTTKNKEAYIPIFKFDDKAITKRYLEYLRYFAEQRKYKIEHGLKMELDCNPTLEKFMYEALGNIIGDQTTHFTNYESMIPIALKNEIETAKQGVYYKGINNAINSRSIVFRNFFKGYTTVRNIVFETIKQTTNIKYLNRTQINKLEKWDHSLIPLINRKNEPECTKISLEDLFPEVFMEAEKSIPKDRIKIKELHL